MSANKDEMPEFPFTNLVAAAAQIKEMYDSFIEVGFTEQQAIQFTLALLQANSGGGDGTS